MDDNSRTAELRRKIDKDPASRLFAQLAEELRKEGRHEEAIQVARKGLEKHPNYPSARLTLARALLDSGRPAEAKPELEQVVKASPDNIMASRLLGDALEDLGSLDAALKQFEHTLRIAPGDKALVEKIADLKARLAPPPTIEIRPAPKPAAPPMVETPAPAALDVPAPQAPPPAAAVALDRDLASGTFSPGSLNASDLQKHFDENHGAEATAAAAPEPAVEPEIERTVAFEHFEGSAAAVTDANAPSTAVDVDRTVAFSELEHFGIREEATSSRAIAGPPPELERDLDRTVAFSEPDPPVAPVAAEEPEVMSLSASSVGLEPLREPTFSTSAPEIAAEPVSMTNPEVASTAELADDDDADIGAQTLPVTSVTLADLYLQQGLKKEASAVLSQVLKDEPGNEAAKSKLEASVLSTEVASEAEQTFSQTAPLTPPWLKAGATPVAPVVEELPDLTAAAPAPPEPTPKAPVPVPSTPAPGRAVDTRKRVRERTLAGMQAFLDAAGREAGHQRATEAQAFHGANQEHRT